MGMGTPTPLTRRISDLALDALAVAHEIQCPVRRETVTDALRRISGQADRLHQARLVARGLEDTGHVSEWQQRKLAEMERAGCLEDAERRPTAITRGE